MSSSSLLELGIRRIRGLATALDFGVPTALLEHRLSAAIEPWGSRAIGQRPHWSSDITDDGTPIEFSVAFATDHAPRLRVLFEAQTTDALGTPRDRWTAAWRTTGRLAKHSRCVDLRRLEAIAPLFEPRSTSDAEFAMWHALDLSQPQGVDAIPKVYLNPRIHGDATAPRLVRQALSGLGHAAAWRDVTERLARHGAYRFVYFSVDLAANGTERTKVYVAHHGASAQQLEQVFDGAEGHASGDVTRWCESVLGQPGPYEQRPVLSCFAFTKPGGAPVGTVHLPVRAYANDDAICAERILAHLPASLDTRYVDAVSAFCDRPLNAGRGVQTYASFRRDKTGPRLTIYLAPQAYSVGPPRSAVRDTSPREGATLGSVEQAIVGHASRLAQTPFCRRLMGPASIDDFRRFSRGLSFFVMAFQDMLRTCTRLVTEHRLQRLAAIHQREDAGHEQWFVHDLRQVGQEPGLVWLFGPEHERVRDITFEMMSELHRATDDRVRIAIVLALEGAGHVFFRRVVGYTERMDAGLALQYFARRHFEVEQAHDIFSDDGPVSLEDVHLEPETMAQALAAVARIFDGFARMAADLEATISAKSTPCAAESAAEGARA